MCFAHDNNSEEAFTNVLYVYKVYWYNGLTAGGITHRSSFMGENETKQTLFGFVFFYMRNKYGSGKEADFWRGTIKQNPQSALVRHLSVF